MQESPGSSGWWQASDGRWYAPDALSQEQAQEQAQALAQAQAQAAQVVRAQSTVPGGVGATDTPGTAAQAGMTGPAGAPGTVEPPTFEAQGTPPVAWWPSGAAGSFPTPTSVGPQAAPRHAGGPMVPPSAGGTGPQSGSLPGYPVFPPGSMYGWGPFVPDSSWRRRRITGAVIVVIGLGLLVWGIGSVYNAVAANGIPTFPRDEQIGLWVNACGILLMSVATIAAGIVQQVL